MLNTNGSGDQLGHMAFNIANSLIDLLIEKGVITRRDARNMLIGIVERLNQSPKFMDQDCAKLIADGMPR